MKMYYQRGADLTSGRRARVWFVRLLFIASLLSLVATVVSHFVIIYYGPNSHITMRWAYSTLLVSVYNNATPSKLVRWTCKRTSLSVRGLPQVYRHWRWRPRTEPISLGTGVVIGEVYVIPGMPLLILLVALTVAAFCLNRKRIRTTSTCPRCDYDLTGNISGVCPECGLSVPPGPTA